MEPQTAETLPAAQPAGEIAAETNYHPLSGLAVAGLVMALASPLAFLHPVLWLLPMAGAAVSAAALRRITLAWPEQAGRRLALLGLCVGLIVAAAAPARLFTR